MFNKKMIVAAFGMAALMSGANAAENKYAGVSVGLSGIDYKVFGGFKFDPMWAVEASFQGLGKDSSSYYNGWYTSKAKVEATSLEVAGVYTHPYSSVLSFHAKAGLGLTMIDASVVTPDYSTSDSSNSIGVVAGVGASYKINERVRARAELEMRSSSDLADKMALSVGVQVGF